VIFQFKTGVKLK
jgi:hypothetical protein